MKNALGLCKIRRAVISRTSRFVSDSNLDRVQLCLALFYKTYFYVDDAVFVQFSYILK